MIRSDNKIFFERFLTNKLIKRGKIMIENNGKNDFFNWVSIQSGEPVDSDAVNKLFGIVEKYAMKKGLLDKPFFENMDVVTIETIVERIESDKQFEFRNYFNNKKIRKWLNLYLSYLKEISSLYNCNYDNYGENFESVNDLRASDIVSSQEFHSEISEFFNSPSEDAEELVDEKVYFEYEDDEESEDKEVLNLEVKDTESLANEEVVDFDDKDEKKLECRDALNSDYEDKEEKAVVKDDDTVVIALDNENIKMLNSFFYPIGIEYFGEIYNDCSSWRDAYKSVVMCLLEDYPDKFSKEIYLNIGHEFKYIVAKKKYADLLKEPVNLNEQLCLEIGLEEKQIFEVLQLLANCCNLDQNNINFLCHFKNQSDEEIVGTNHNCRNNTKKYTDNISSDSKTENNEYKDNLKVCSNENKIKSIELGNKDIINSLRVSQPIGVKYFGQIYEDCENWIQVYKQLVLCLQKDYPSVICNEILIRFEEEIKLICARDSKAYLLDRPEKIGEQWCLETNVDVIQIVEILRELASRCNIEFANIAILCKINTQIDGTEQDAVEFHVSSYQSKLTEHVESKILQAESQIMGNQQNDNIEEKKQNELCVLEKINHKDSLIKDSEIKKGEKTDTKGLGLNKIGFSRFLDEQTDLKENTKKLYKTFIVICESFIWNNMIGSRTLYGSVVDAKEILNNIESLMQNKEFQKFDQKRSCALSATLKKYREYIYQTINGDKLEKKTISLAEDNIMSEEYKASISNKKKMNLGKDEFLEYLNKTGTIVPEARRLYANKILECEVFAEANGISKGLYDADSLEHAIMTVKMLLESEMFIENSRKQDNIPVKALEKYSEFLNSNQQEVECEEDGSFDLKRSCNFDENKMRKRESEEYLEKDDFNINLKSEENKSEITRETYLHTVQDSNVLTGDCHLGTNLNSNQQELNEILVRLEKNYQNNPAESFQQILEENTYAYHVDEMYREVYGISAKEGLEKAGLILSDKEKLDRIVKTLQEKYREEKASSFYELRQENPDINFNLVVILVPQIYNKQVKAYFEEVGILENASIQNNISTKEFIDIDIDINEDSKENEKELEKIDAEKRIDEILKCLEEIYGDKPAETLQHVYMVFPDARELEELTYEVYGMSVKEWLIEKNILLSDKQKLMNLEKILKERYPFHKATSIYKITIENPDINSKLLVELPRLVYGKSAKEYFEEIGVLKSFDLNGLQNKFIEKKNDDEEFNGLNEITQEQDEQLNNQSDEGFEIGMSAENVIADEEKVLSTDDVVQTIDSLSDEKVFYQEECEIIGLDKTDTVLERAEVDSSSCLAELLTFDENEKVFIEKRGEGESEEYCFIKKHEVLFTMNKIELRMLQRVINKELLAKNVERKGFTEEEALFIESRITGIYFEFEEMKSAFKRQFPERQENVFSTKNLMDIGYRTLKNNIVVLEEIKSVDELLERLFFKHRVVDFSENEWILKCSSVYTILSQMKKSYSIVEFEKNKFVNIRELNQIGLDKTLIMDYCEEVKKFINKRVFSVFYLQSSGFSHSLDDFGFETYFYESILKNNNAFRSARYRGQVLFKQTKDKVSYSDLIVEIVENEGAIDIYDMQKLLMSDYGVKIDLYSIRNFAKEGDLYYSETMEKIYLDYDNFFEEI